MKLVKPSTQKPARGIDGNLIQAAIALGVVALASLGWASNSHAETYLQIYRSSGGNSIHTTSRGRTTVARLGTKIRVRQDTLTIPGDNKSWVALQFLEDGIVKNYGGLLLKTIPSWQPTSYRFPCTASGNFHITWRPIVKRGRACGGGLTLVRASQLSELPPDRNDNVSSVAFDRLFAVFSWPLAARKVMTY